MLDSLSAFSDGLEIFLNFLELFALIVSISTFFILMLNQYAKALKKILSPSGITFWMRLRVLILCRNSAVKKRAFLEFALLKTHGRSVNPSEWRAIISEFKAYYSDNQERPTYSIPNCTLLIDDNLSLAAKRYFDFFNKDSVKKVFGIKDDIIKWVTTIHIEEAYAMPTFLLTGLLSQYEENWSEFIKRYVSTAYITEAQDSKSNIILPEELYFTFAWLLWGPSYELNYTDYWTGLCQLSFGDESNSIPAIATPTNNIATKIAEKFRENAEKRYGALISADLSVYSNSEYYKSVRDNVTPEYNYFYDKLESGSMSFALQIDDFTPFDGYKAQKYYCTAYVWILFELEDETTYEFHPEASLAFFEHANLTDLNSYEFLVDMLLNKSIKHFEKIFSEKEFSNRKYRFVCAMNKDIEDKFRERYSKRSKDGDELSEEFKTRIIKEAKRSPADAFLAYDEFFSQSSSVMFSEVFLNKKDTIMELGNFYTEVYMDCFPDENERENFNNLLKYLKNAENADDYTYHIVLAKDECGDIIAGAIFDYFKRSNCGIIEFIAVKKNLQSGGVGTRLYNYVVSKLQSDAFKYNRKRISYIFCEIDSPEHSKEDVKKYLYFWNKHKYKRIEMNYIQPSLSASQESVDGLWLTVTSLDRQIREIPSEVVSDVIHDYLKYAMEITDPNNNEEFRKMSMELSGSDSVGLSYILDK